jgi:hypothetical protein
MIETLICKIQQPFLAQCLNVSLLGVYVATRAENSRGWIGKDYNAGGEHNTPENGHRCMGRLVRYHHTTVTSKNYT